MCRSARVTEWSPSVSLAFGMTAASPSWAWRPLHASHQPDLAAPRLKTNSTSGKELFPRTLQQKPPKERHGWLAAPAALTAVGPDRRGGPPPASGMRRVSKFGLLSKRNQKRPKMRPQINLLPHCTGKYI